MYILFQTIPADSKATELLLKFAKALLQLQNIGILSYLTQHPLQSDEIKPLVSDLFKNKLCTCFET